MSKSQVKEANVTPPVKGILRHLKWEHLVAGVSGGAASTLLLHPLDLVKIRFQGKKKCCSELQINIQAKHDHIFNMRGTEIQTMTIIV